MKLQNETTTTDPLSSEQLEAFFAGKLEVRSDNMAPGGYEEFIHIKAGEMNEREYEEKLLAGWEYVINMLLQDKPKTPEEALRRLETADNVTIVYETRLTYKNYNKKFPLSKDAVGGNGAQLEGITQHGESATRGCREELLDALRIRNLAEGNPLTFQKTEVLIAMLEKRWLPKEKRDESEA